MPMSASYLGLASSPDSSGWMIATSPSSSGSRTALSQRKKRRMGGSTSRTKPTSRVASWMRSTARATTGGWIVAVKKGSASQIGWTSRSASSCVPFSHRIMWEKGTHEEALREVQPIWLADPFFTATIQPPVVARAVLRIHEATRDVGFVRDVLPPIRRFFRWLKAVREPDDAGLVAIIQPDESGPDASPQSHALLGISPAPPAQPLPRLQ